MAVSISPEFAAAAALDERRQEQINNQRHIIDTLVGKHLRAKLLAKQQIGAGQDADGHWADLLLILDEPSKPQ